MTDKKAVEVLKSWLRLAYQNADGTDECCAELYEALQTVFALINRQQEEIERLKNENMAKEAEYNDMLEQRNSVERYPETAKSEAVKEFAARLKCEVPQETGVIRCSDVNNLVKEMVSEKE